MSENILEKIIWEKEREVIAQEFPQHEGKGSYLTHKQRSSAPQDKAPATKAITKAEREDPCAHKRSLTPASALRAPVEATSNQIHTH